MVFDRLKTLLEEDIQVGIHEKQFRDRHYNYFYFDPAQSIRIVPASHQFLFWLFALVLEVNSCFSIHKDIKTIVAKKFCIL